SLRNARASHDHRARETGAHPADAGRAALCSVHVRVRAAGSDDGPGFRAFRRALVSTVDHRPLESGADTFIGGWPRGARRRNRWATTELSTSPPPSHM